MNVGDILTGTVTEFTRRGAEVLLDGGLTGSIGPLDLSWSFHRPRAEILQPGDRVTAEVIAIDDEILQGAGLSAAGQSRQRLRLSRSATENPQLWAFLKALSRGQRLSGTVAAIKNFGVFVDLDDGPKHPTFPGVGFLTIPELAWHRFSDPAEIVSIGQHITCEFIIFDTTYGEARLSLRATRPDPFIEFARTHRAGQVLTGSITKLIPFGAFVLVQDGIEGLIHLSDLSPEPIETPEQAVHLGEEVTVTITAIDVPQHRLRFARYP